MKLLCLLTFSCILSLSTLAQNEPQGISVNKPAPGFKAKNQNGKLISLQDELKNGPVVVIFYRGQWCPYCNKQLKQLEDSLTFILAKGATLIAVTPEIPTSITKTIEKTKATYSILYDEGLSIMKSYDVAFTVDSSTVERYKNYGIDLVKSNGPNANNLPVPAVYIITQKGIISFRHFDPDYKKRISVKEILSHL